MLNIKRIFFLCIIAIMVIVAIYIGRHLSSGKPLILIPKDTNLSEVTIAPENIPTVLINQMYDQRQQNLSSLSLRLIVAGQWGNHAQYNAVKQDMLRLLQLEDKMYSGSEIDEINERMDARQAWMLGRMIVSALNIKDMVTAKNLANIIEGYLHQSAVKNAPSAFSVWANGYLLEYYAKVAPEAYTKNIEDMLNSANAVIAHFKTQQNDPAQSDNATSTILWIDVVNLYATAVGKDKVHYDAIKTAMLTDTNSQTMAQALDKIPATDFPAWAYYWTLRAATVADDTILMTELDEYANSNDMLNKLKAQIDDANVQLAKDPKNTVLITAQESLLDDYVLGVTNKLFAEYIE